MEEYSPDGALQVEYVYGNNLITQEQGNSRTYYHFDGLGSTRLLTDTTGSIVSNYNYEAYGELINSTGAVENKYLFAGEALDEELGDYYNRARYYDTDTGRFTRRDTYEGKYREPLTLHKYIYTHDNPVNYIDPSGKTTLAENNIVYAILNTLQNLFFLQAGARLLVGDLGSPLPKIVWTGSISIDQYDSQAADLSLGTGTAIDNFAKFEPSFFDATATATSSTGKTWSHKIQALGFGLSIALSNPENSVVKEALDFEVVTDRIYGDGPSSLRGLFNLNSASIPNGLEQPIQLKTTYGFIRFGNASGFAGSNNIATNSSVFGIGFYLGYSGMGYL